VATSVQIIQDRVRRVPEGFVTTYGDLSPGAARQAGRALALATDPELPWWRVVRSDGSWAKGERQRRLLKAEGIPMRGDRVVLREARIDPEVFL
jgi:alkylated DNA nucleotide flippase Atl1